MEKIKVNFEGVADLHSETMLKIGDTNVTVRDHIPLEQKAAFVDEYIQLVLDEDEDAGVMQMTSVVPLLEVFLMVKYYTNVDVEGVKLEDVYNWVINNNSYTDLEDIIYHDIEQVRKMYGLLSRNAIEAYEREHSLGKAIQKSFGFMLNGEDITETLAKSREITDQMIDVVEQLHKNQPPKVKAEAAGKLMVGGNIVSIGKKQK